jgi:hypothetical protein
MHGDGLIEQGVVGVDEADDPGRILVTAEALRPAVADGYGAPSRVLSLASDLLQLRGQSIRQNLRLDDRAAHRKKPRSFRLASSANDHRTQQSVSFCYLPDSQAARRGPSVGPVQTDVGPPRQEGRLRERAGSLAPDRPSWVHTFSLNGGDCSLAVRNGSRRTSPNQCSDAGHPWGWWVQASEAGIHRPQFYRTMRRFEGSKRSFRAF